MRNGATVLVVEAHSPTRAILADLFYAEGLQPLLAADTESARRLLAEHRPALMLADLEIGETSGMVLDEIRRSDPRLVGVPLILTTRLTARSVEHLVTQVDLVLHKPYSIETLFAYVHRFCRPEDSARLPTRIAARRRRG